MCKPFKQIAVKIAIEVMKSDGLVQTSDSYMRHNIYEGNAHRKFSMT